MNYTALISQNTTLKLNKSGMIKNLQVDIESINNLSVLESKEHRLSEKWKHYTSIASKFKEFLLQTSTEDS